MNIFQNNTKNVPMSDPQIVRVDMEQQDIGGRKSHLATINQSSNYTPNQAGITHIPNADGGR